MLYWNFVSVYGFTNIEYRTETGCAGRCSYQYSLQCPKSQKIAIRHLEYATKEVSQTCPDIPEPCQDKQQCCLYDGGDCRIQFTDSAAAPVYTQCSGKRECYNLRADHISTFNRCFYQRNASNYVAATYTCVNGKT